MKSYKSPEGCLPLSLPCPQEAPGGLELDKPHTVQLGKLRFRVAKDLLS